jgi:hypothetical protein
VQEDSSHPSSQRYGRENNNWKRGAKEVKKSEELGVTGPQNILIKAKTVL